MTIDPVVFAALVTLVTGILAYVLRENARYKKENWQLLQAIYENQEAMKRYADLRQQGGQP